MATKPGEFQTAEYAPDGPVRLLPIKPDTRGRLNSDGTKSTIVAERPVHTSDRELLLSAIMRIEVLELQVRNLRNLGDLARR